MNRISPPLTGVEEPELICIPAGFFSMGSPEQDAGWADGYPQHELYLDTFYIAKTLVTWSQFEAFETATGNRVRPRIEAYIADLGLTSEETQNLSDLHCLGQGDDLSHYPINWVSWYDAYAYCQWLTQVTGRIYQLPSEAEWEKAARGVDGRIYPWGNEPPNPQLVNFRSSDTTPVGHYPEGASPYGVLDMAGNLWEWTRSLGGNKLNPSAWYGYPYDSMDGREEVAAPAQVPRVLRGGSYVSSGQLHSRGSLRCAARFGATPDFPNFDFGFRLICREAAH